MAGNSMGTTGRTGGPRSPVGSKKSSMMPKPTSMRRSTGLRRGGKMEKHNVSKGMPSIKHARLSKPRGRLIAWGKGVKQTATLWTARVKKK